MKLDKNGFPISEIEEIKNPCVLEHYEKEVIESYEIPKCCLMGDYESNNNKCMECKINSYKNNSGQFALCMEMKRLLLYKISDSEQLVP